MREQQHVYRRTAKLVAALCLLASLHNTESFAQCLFPYWQPLHPAQQPTGLRSYHATAYDSKRRVTVLFGGLRATCFGCPDPTPDDVLKDTWEFDGTTWTQRFPATVPFGLDDHAMSYDPVRGVTVMFGGTAGTNGFPSSGFLWEWDGDDWRNVPSVGPHPAPRYGHKMVYDSARHVHVMYGGWVYSRDPGEPSDTPKLVTETWEYDAPAQTWTLRSTNGPGKRFGFDLAYDSVRNQTVLFGGDLSDAPDYPSSFGNDTWVWDGNTWQQLNPERKPAGRKSYAMTFDSTRGVAVLMGGIVYNGRNGSVVSSETWEWNGSVWIFSSSCCAFAGHTMSYEVARQQVLLIYHGETVNDPMTTWAYASGNGNAVNYVDWSNLSGFEDGSLAFPFRTLPNAVSCTLGGAAISMRGGDYAEGFQQITKQVRITANNGQVHIH